jgi:hypothetical protein
MIHCSQIVKGGDRTSRLPIRDKSLCCLERDRHNRKKESARSAVPFAVKFLQGFQVDGTWKVPTTFTFVGCDIFENA